MESSISYAEIQMRLIVQRLDPHGCVPFIRIPFSLYEHLCLPQSGREPGSLRVLHSTLAVPSIAVFWTEKTQCCSWVVPWNIYIFHCAKSM